MKRMTGKRDGAEGYWLICEDECDNDLNCSFCERDSEALDKLGEYEDAEERGELVRVVRGRWKGEGLGDYRCSVCDHVTFGKPNFCPNCGAQMDADMREVDDG